MTLDENNLVKLLEYGSMSLEKTYTSIAKLLQLEYYHEEKAQVFTLSSDSFVLDIMPEHTVLLFVDESLSDRASYIQFYFDEYLSKKHIFYYLLKYFVLLDRSTIRNTNLTANLPNNITTNPLLNCKGFCKCIFTNEYCFKTNLAAVPEGFNIFTHKFDLKDKKSNFVYLNKAIKELRAVKTNVESQIDSIEIDDYNLARYFPAGEYNRETRYFFKNSENCFFEEGEIKVSKDNDVYINEKRIGVASFMFKKGCFLSDCLDYFKSIQK